MKILSVILLFLSINLGAQEPVQFLKMKNADRSVDITLKNNSDKLYSVAVKMELENMTSTAILPIRIDLQPNSSLHLTTLSPITKEAVHYLINYRLVELENENFQYEPNITIYTKNKNTRSTQLMIYLSQNGIAYNEINTSYNGDTKAMYLDMLKRRGIEKKEAQLPVIIYKGEVFYDIKDIKKFCDKHFADQARFVRKKDRRY